MASSQTEATEALLSTRWLWTAVRPRVRADAADTRWHDCCSFSPSVGQTLPQQCWHVSSLMTDSSLTVRCPLSKAHMDKNKPICTHTRPALIKEQRPAAGLREEKRHTAEVGYGEVDYSACAGSNFSHERICKGLSDSWRRMECVITAFQSTQLPFSHLTLALRK